MLSTIGINFAGIQYKIEGIDLKEETGQFLDGFMGFSDSDVVYTVKINRNASWQIKDSEFQTLPEWNKDTLKIGLSFCDVEIDFVRRNVFVLTGKYIGLFGLLRFLSAMHLVRNNGFLLHASSLTTVKGVYVFSGVSESGKTTIARMAEENMRVLTDETTAIFKNQSVFEAHATPFAGELGNLGFNSGSKLKALFFIRKDNSFWHRRLEKQEVVKELFRNAIFTALDQKIIETVFNTFISFAENVSCYELGFNRSKDLWRYIDGIAG
ncbi:MAG: hypothetical protein HZC15_03420 [Candidatus Omnitrophica bacterium]|nr:hypothetical protein [Candidatus Omnitrophota bacterium]